MTRLTIRLLGTPEISYGERPVSFRTRKVLALLIYLVVEKGMHSRESLMALLWPETDAQKAAVTLRGTLSRLRQALQPAGAVLITEVGKVGFDFDGDVDIDLDWLATAVRPETSPDDLAAILDLDRGEFLAGFSLPDAPEFDTWAAIERQTYQWQVETVYERLAQRQLATGNGATAVETARRWLARAPLNELAYRSLMAAQALSGHRAAALTTYAQCQKQLKTELNIEPAKETTELAERIRTAGMPSPLPHATVPQPFLMPFVGRSDEHSQLAAAFHQTMAAGVRVCAVIGAGGVGKTRLVQAFLEWAVLDTPNVDVCQGRAFEMGGRLPYEPVMEALRLRLDQENAPEDLLEDVWLTELSQLMPELRGRYPDLPPPLTGDAGFMRSRLFAAVATLGSALAERRPVVFVLDDMQWADIETQDMIHYAARRWAEGSAPIFLLLIVRQENYAADASLREWLTRLERVSPMRRLLLDSLSGTAVQHLIANLESGNRGADPPPATETVRTLPRPSTQAFADWLWAETNGLPFFIEALLQMLIEQGVLTVQEETGGGYDFSSALQHVHAVTKVPLPPGVYDAILARLERLTETESALLLAAAVMGRECSFGRLCQVADLDETTALPALESLLNGRLLTQGGNARRPYTLAHDYIREVVYNASGETRRRVFHRRSLFALEADGAPAAECAYHAVASLLDEPAFRHSLAAGDEALATHALQESLAHYNRALDAARMVGLGTTAVDSQLLRRLYTNRGRSLELSEQFESAQINYQEMVDLADERNDSAMRLAALTSQCIVRATQTPLFNASKARTLAEEALALAQQLGDQATEAKVLWGMLLVEITSDGDLQKGLEYGLRSLELARQMGLNEQMGFTNQDLANAYQGLNRLADANRTYQAAVTIWQALGNIPMLIDAYNQQQSNLFFMGELAASLALGEEAVRLSRSIDHAWSQVVSLGFLIQTVIEIGDPGRAAEMIHERERITAAVGAGFHTSYKYLICQHRLSLALSLGVWNHETQLAAEIYANRHELIPIFLHYLMAFIIQFEVARGNLDLAQQIWAEISPDWHLDKSAPYVAGPLSATALYLLLAQKNLQPALEYAQNVAERFRRIGCLAYLPEVLWLQGRAELGLKQWTQAHETLTEALNISQRNGECRLRWRILSSLAEVAEAQRQPGAADRYKKMGQEVVTTIAGRIDNEELRSAFLATTAVQQLFPANK